MITLRLPWPPTGNLTVRHTKSGAHYRTAASKNYQKAVAAEAMIQGLHRLTPLVGRLRVIYHCWPPDARRRDLDNIAKTLNDALTYAGVWKDDSQIDDLQLSRCRIDPKGAGSVFLFLEEMA